MITEIESLYSRLDRLPVTPAERALAKARLEQAEAFAAAVQGAVAKLSQLVRGRRHKGQGLWGLKHSDTRA
ncbi:MAG TPA: hypothetical protein VFV84_06200 [Burkholderiales bacterium]|nr:hypothetical protein [Burkholderiales bacterium]